MLVRLKPISRKWLVFVSVWEERPDSLHISIPVGANINLQTSKSQNVLLFSYEWIWDRVWVLFPSLTWKMELPVSTDSGDRRNKTVLLKVEHTEKNKTQLLPFESLLSSIGAKWLRIMGGSGAGQGWGEGSLPRETVSWHLKDDKAVRRSRSRQEDLGGRRK